MYPLHRSSTSAYITEGPDGNLWFTENLTDPNTQHSVAIGQITAAGQIQTFTLPKEVRNERVGWGTSRSARTATSGSPSARRQSKCRESTMPSGRITAKGNVKLYTSFRLLQVLTPALSPPTDIISGPDGKLWYQSHGRIGTTGIARISTSGKLGSFIPAASLDARTWCVCRTARFGSRAETSQQLMDWASPRVRESW